MEISNMITMDGHFDGPRSAPPAPVDTGHGHPYPTRHSLHANGVADPSRTTPPVSGGVVGLRSPSMSLLKNVSFELQLDSSTSVRGRLPMRVQIFPHDTTESIVTTVKNFYGLYDSGTQEVNFEDVDGKPVEASYDNLSNNMTVYVRVMPDLAPRSDLADPRSYRPASPQRLTGGMDNVPMLPPQPAQLPGYGQPPSRPVSRVSRKQSVSPRMSQGKLPVGPKGRSRSGLKSTGSSFQAGLDELNSDAHNGYSSSDGGAGSVTSSRKARSELLATAEISVDNIVEGDRRQKAKFESSELPLFVPPQVPAPNSISSVSPQRRVVSGEEPSPFMRPPPHTLALQPPGHGAPVFGASDQAASAPPTASPFTIPPVPTHGHRLRDRTSGNAVSARSSLGSTNRFYGSNILPTPDPTIASCISDEDVALQLMRLGDASNFSHGRTSASTLDDGFSGRAELASSGTSDESDVDDSDDSGTRHVKREYSADQVGPPLKKQRRHTDDGSMAYNGMYSGDEMEASYGARVHGMGKMKARTHKVKKARATDLSIKTSKYTKPSKQAKSGSGSNGVAQPMSPSSLPPSSRKTSATAMNFPAPLGIDEDDLSSKPRCQRCRKSKKGCDRQRPCGRCKDAGIGIEGCISEDESNGRKGRYGRHMGVAIKRGEQLMGAAMMEEMGATGDALDSDSEQAGAILSGMADEQLAALNKKRKR